MGKSVSYFVGTEQFRRRNIKEHFGEIFNPVAASKRNSVGEKHLREMKRRRCISREIAYSRLWALPHNFALGGPAGPSFQQLQPSSRGREGCAARLSLSSAQQRLFLDLACNSNIQSLFL